MAIALGSLLLAGIMDVYLGVSNSSQRLRELWQVQNSGRMAAIILGKSIRVAGYSGCIANRLPWAIRGFTKASAPPKLRNKVARGDVIVISKADAFPTQLNYGVKAGSKQLKVINSPASLSQRQLLIADCAHAELVTAKNYARRTINLKHSLTYAYSQQDTQVSRFEEIAYFIGRTSRKDARGSREYALYQVLNYGRRQELIPGIIDMKVGYQVRDSYGKLQDHLSASQVVNWDSVVAVNITLYVRENNNMIRQWPLYFVLRERIL
ncbi:MAG: PilW family protein [Gammaproteobacteria bacterium]|nr:PilW family protein [Gammaproteobacteria bacterium]